MTATDVTAPALLPTTRGPLFPEPLGPYDPAAEGDRTDAMTLYGYCARWCVQLEDNRKGGMSVDEHGPHCEALSLLFVNGADAEGGSRDLYGCLVKAYQHGQYRREDYRNGYGRAPIDPFDGPIISLVMTEWRRGQDDVEQAIYLHAGEARRAAAALVRLADLADGLA